MDWPSNAAVKTKNSKSIKMSLLLLFHLLFGHVMNDVLL